MVSRGQRNGPLRSTVFLDRSRYFFFQLAPQLYSRGWVDPVPDPLLPSSNCFTGSLSATDLLYWSSQNNSLEHFGQHCLALGLTPMTYMQSLIEIGSSIEKLIGWDAQTQRQKGDCTSPLLENRLIQTRDILYWTRDIGNRIRVRKYVYDSFIGVCYLRLRDV
jgi:hypothetical protein